MKKAGLVIVVLLLILAAGIILSPYFKPKLTGEVMQGTHTWLYLNEETPDICVDSIGEHLDTFDEGAKECEDYGKKQQKSWESKCKGACIENCTHKEIYTLSKYGNIPQCQQKACGASIKNGVLTWSKDSWGNFIYGPTIINCYEDAVKIDLSRAYFTHTQIPEPQYLEIPFFDSYEIPLLGRIKIGEEKFACEAYHKCACRSWNSGIGDCGCQDIDEDGYCTCRGWEDSPPITKTPCEVNSLIPPFPEQIRMSEADCNDEPNFDGDDCWTYYESTGFLGLGEGKKIVIPEEERNLKTYFEGTGEHPAMEGEISCGKEQYRYCAKCVWAQYTIYNDYDGDVWPSNVLEGMCVNPNNLPPYWYIYEEDEVKDRLFMKYPESSIKLRDSIYHVMLNPEERDCDDTNQKRYSQASEKCDPIDRDCDGNPYTEDGQLIAAKGKYIEKEGKETFVCENGIWVPHDPPRHGDVLLKIPEENFHAILTLNDAGSYICDCEGKCTDLGIRGSCVFVDATIGVGKFDLAFTSVDSKYCGTKWLAKIGFLRFGVGTIWPQDWVWMKLKDAYWGFCWCRGLFSRQGAQAQEGTITGTITTESKDYEIEWHNNLTEYL